MAKVLLVAGADLLEKLEKTVLWRPSVERIVAPNVDAAFDLARSSRPNVVVLDARDDGSRNLIGRLRADPIAREVSIAVMLPAAASARDWGGNALLHEEQGPALWDDSFEDLLNVPPRRAVRIAVRLTPGPRAADGLAQVDALAANISVRGVMVEVPAPLAVGSIWSLSLALTDRPDPLRLVGKVVWQRTAANGFHCGIEFLGFHGDALGVIGSLVSDPPPPVEG